MITKIHSRHIMYMVYFFFEILVCMRCTIESFIHAHISLSLNEHTLWLRFSQEISLQTHFQSAYNIPKFKIEIRINMSSFLLWALNTPEREKNKCVHSLMGFTILLFFSSSLSQIFFPPFASQWMSQSRKFDVA